MLAEFGFQSQFSLLRSPLEALELGILANTTQIATAANGYDLALALYTVAKERRSKPSASELLESLRQLPPLKGAAGTFQYREDAVGGSFFDFPITMKRVVGREIVPIEDGVALERTGLGQSS